MEAEAEGSTSTSSDPAIFYYKEVKMFKRLVKAIRSSFYDTLTIREDGSDDYLGEVITNCIPRIGEDIKVADEYYNVRDVVYNLQWDRIGSVDILVEKSKHHNEPR